MEEQKPALIAGTFRTKVQRTTANIKGGVSIIIDVTADKADPARQVQRHGEALAGILAEAAAGCLDEIFKGQRVPETPEGEAK